MTSKIRKIEKQYRIHNIEIIEANYLDLPETEKTKLKEDFRAFLDGSDIYLASFQKDGWKSLICAPRIVEFWKTHSSLPFPTFEDFAKTEGIEDLMSFRERMVVLEKH